MKLVVAIRDGCKGGLLAVSRLLGRPDIQIVAVLLDDPPKPGMRQRVMAAAREPGAIPLRLLTGLADALELKACRLVSDEDLWKLLETAFPDRIFRPEGLRLLNRFPVLRSGELRNDGQRLSTLPEPDLGVWLSAPPAQFPPLLKTRMGWVTVDNCFGADDDVAYREIQGRNGAIAATARLRRDGSRDGATLGETRVSVHPKDTPASLKIRLDAAGADLLVDCLGTAAGTALTCPAQTAAVPRLTWKEKYDLDIGTGARQPPLRILVRAVYCLLLWHSGVFYLWRAAKRWMGKNTAAIVLYHRIDEHLQDGLTVRVEQFARQMLALRGRYSVVSTAALVDLLKSGRSLPPHMALIHFDDCYRSVYTEASPVLKALRYPACAFVSSGFVDTARVFEHDEGEYPVALPNLTNSDLIGLIGNGFEIGAHTVNHANLGTAETAAASREIGASKAALEQATGCIIRFFSVPFGRQRNIAPDTLDIIRRLGFEANFSAQGGLVGRHSECYSIPRIGAPHRNILEFLLHLEGLSLAALIRRFREYSSVRKAFLKSKLTEKCAG